MIPFFSPASICNAALLSFVCPVLQQIDYLLSQYATARNKVIYDLDSKWTCSAQLTVTTADRRLSLSVINRAYYLNFYLL